MLLDLIRGNELSSIVLVKDNVDCIDASNVHILYNFLLNQSQRFAKVILLCYEDSPESYTHALPENIKSRIVCLDGTKHPHTWLDFHDFDQTGVDGNIKKLLEDNLPQGNGNIGIVIDSLSFHLLLRPPSFTCQFLRKLSTSQIKGYDIKQLVCGIHGDIFDENSLRLVEHTASSVLILSPSQTPSHTSICSSIHHRTSGKVLRMNEYFNVDENNIVQDLREVKSTAGTTEPGEKSIDPASNLTFNLTLKESEKEARSQLVLPYTYDKNKQDAALNQPGGGKIFYEADDVDDLDEEDPDDDLHI
ncbi:hypothetical protein SNE40_014535 [Patella caerulea]|uniref:Elongator complex protein 5 n=1 Tax=Patella caerulea TaxID=87958 RepID=A0AAN8JEW0_PATCE